MHKTAFQLTPQRALSACSVGDALDGVVEGVPAWIDVDGIDADVLEEAFAALGLHPLAIEASLTPTPTPGLVTYGDSLFLELPVQTAWNAAKRSFLRVVCMPSVIMTIHEGEIPALRHIAQRYSSGLRLPNETVSALVYQILDHIIDEDMAFTLRTREALDRLEEFLDNDDDDALTEGILPLKRQMSRLTATLEDHLYCLSLLQKVESESFSVGGLHDYFRDAYSHLEHASRSIARQTGQLNAVQQEHQLKLQDQTNSRLRLLTIVSTIFLPLTLIAGIYGMNFENMPELTWRHGYEDVIGAMVLIAGGMLWGFYRAGWFR